MHSGAHQLLICFHIKPLLRFWHVLSGQSLVAFYIKGLPLQKRLPLNTFLQGCIRSQNRSIDFPSVEQQVQEFRSASEKGSTADRPSRHSFTSCSPYSAASTWISAELTRRVGTNCLANSMTSNHTSSAETFLQSFLFIAP